MAGVEGGAAVAGGDDNGDAGFADVEMPKTVDHGDSVDVPGLANEDADLFQFLECHRFVGFVNQMQRALPFRVVTNHALENTNRAVFASQHPARDLLGIDRVPSDLVDLARPADEKRIRLNFASTHGWEN